MTQQKTISAQAWVFLGLLSLMWGGSFLTVRIALDEIGPMTVVLHRVGWAMLVLWVYIWIKGFSLPKDWRIWGAFGVMGMLTNVIPFSLLAWGQQYIETGLTGILNATAAVFGVLVAAMLLRDERLTLRKAIGVILGFLGVATAIGLEALTHLDLRSLAQWAVILATLSYACGAVWGRTRLTGMRPEVATAGTLTCSTALMVPIVLWTEGMPSLDLSPRSLLAIGYYSVIATAAAFLLYYRLLALAGSGNTMLVTLMVAPVAILLGTLVLDETLPPQAFIGFALLAVGLLILNRTLFPRAQW